jgi:hypothetical protein
MNKIVHHTGLDVHKDSIAVSIAPQNSTEGRRYGVSGGGQWGADGNPDSESSFAVAHD